MRGFSDVITAVRERADSLTVGVAMAVVSFCSGFISYTHIQALTEREGGSWKVSHLYPFCIDGQLVIGSAYFMYGETRWQKFWGLVLGVVPGIAESLVANWESGIVHGLFAAGWATIPAQAFACSTILFERWLHRRRELRPDAAAQPHGSLMSLLGWPPAVPVPAASPDAAVAPPVPELPLVHPAPAGTPRGLVTPAEFPQQAPALPQFPKVPVLGPYSPLPARPKRAAARSAPQGTSRDDTRLPLPEGAELAVLLSDPGISANQISRDYAVSRWTANQLKKQFAAGLQDEEEVSSDAA